MASLMTELPSYTGITTVSGPDRPLLADLERKIGRLINRPSICTIQALSRPAVPGGEGIMVSWLKGNPLPY